MPLGDLEGSSSSRGFVGTQQALVALSGRPAVPLFSTGEHSPILDFAPTTTVHSTSNNQLPQSAPFSGALPAVPAPGGSSMGGAGPDAGGMLTLLLIVLLGGKALWYARNFIKPNSVYGLIINQPG